MTDVRFLADLEPQPAVFGDAIFMTGADTDGHGYQSFMGFSNSLNGSLGDVGTNTAVAVAGVYDDVGRIYARFVGKPGSDRLQITALDRADFGDGHCIDGCQNRSRITRFQDECLRVERVVGRNRFFVCDDDLRCPCQEPRW